MRKVVLMLLASIAVASATAQEVSNYIDVEGRAEIEVTPNEFTLNILIDESATRGVRGIDDAEQRMRAALQGVGVDVEAKLSVIKMSATDLKREGSNSSILYKLEVASGEMVRKVFKALQGEGITGVTIKTTDHSDIETYKREVIKLAVANGRERAQVVADALGQRMGAAYQVSRVYSNVQSGVGGYDLQIRGVSAAPSPMNHAQPAPALEFGEMTVSGNVTLRFVLDLDKESKTMIIK